MGNIKTHNKYDVYIMLLIVSVIGGGSGGAFEPIRLLSLLLMPAAFPLLKTRNDKKLNNFIYFFVFWYVYMVISMVWTSDTGTGLKELIYYPIHFLLFLEIYVFSKQSDSPLFTISLSWVVALLITTLIGVWEINTGNHLATSFQADSSVIRGYGGMGYSYNFAAVNFGNYNAFNVFISYSFPFVLYFLSEKKNIYRIVSMVAILMGTYILITNASRGALLSVIIMFFLYAIFVLLGKSRFVIKVGFLIVAFLLIVFIIYAWNQIAGLLLFRMENTEFGADENRIRLWTAAFSLFLNSGGFGTGVGSLAESMSEIGHIVPHNAFLELLMQYGAVISLIVIIYLLKILSLFRKATDKRLKILGYTAVIPMPFYFIIDSSYLLKPQLWVLLVSIIVFALNSSGKRVLKNNRVKR